VVTNKSSADAARRICALGCRPGSGAPINPFKYLQSSIGPRPPPNWVSRAVLSARPDTGGLVAEVPAHFLVDSENIHARRGAPLERPQPHATICCVRGSDRHQWGKCLRSGILATLKQCRNEEYGILTPFRNRSSNDDIPTHSSKDAHTHAPRTNQQTKAGIKRHLELI